MFTLKQRMLDAKEESRLAYLAMDRARRATTEKRRHLNIKPFEDDHRMIDVNTRRQEATDAYAKADTKFNKLYDAWEACGFPED